MTRIITSFPEFISNGIFRDFIPVSSRILDHVRPVEEGSLYLESVAIKDMPVKSVYVSGIYAALNNDTGLASPYAILIEEFIKYERNRHDADDRVISGAMTLIYEIYEIIQEDLQILSEYWPSLIAYAIYRIMVNVFRLDRDRFCSDLNRGPFIVKDVALRRCYYDIVSRVLTPRILLNSPKSWLLEPRFRETRERVANLEINDKLEQPIPGIIIRRSSLFIIAHENLRLLIEYNTLLLILHIEEYNIPRSIKILVDFVVACYYLDPILPKDVDSINEILLMAHDMSLITGRLTHEIKRIIRQTPEIQDKIPDIYTSFMSISNKLLSQYPSDLSSKRKAEDEEEEDSLHKTKK